MKICECASSNGGKWDYDDCFDDLESSKKLIVIRYPAVFVFVLIIRTAKPCPIYKQ